MTINSLLDQLKRDEGWRPMPYRDSVGKLTIGYGRNLDDVGISMIEGEKMLDADILRTTARLESAFPWTSTLDEVRCGVLVNMAFNMGVGGLAQFKNMLAKVQSGDYAGAAQEMLDSKWATQVGDRAQRLATQMESGEYV